MSDGVPEQAWNQQRLEREWRRARTRLADIVSENADAPLHLAAVRFSGTSATRPSFLASVCAPYLSPRDTLSSLDQVLKDTSSLSNALAQFDIFATTDARLERSPSVFAADEDVDLVFAVREKPRFFLRTATDVGNSEGSATATARIRNVFGGAEHLEANLAFGTRTRSAFQLAFSSPLPFYPDPATRLELDAFAAERDLSFFASARERLIGAHAKLKTLSALGIHEFAYEAVHRNITDLDAYASMSMRQQSGENIKSALTHSLTRDTRDDSFVPTHGSFSRIFNEYAGLGGDASHLKTESEYSISRKLPHGCSYSFALRTGFLYPFGGNAPAFSDRFQLGGPTSIRLFRPNSIGPKDNSDYLGGEMVWSAGLSAFTPLPVIPPEWPLLGHLWTNVGKLSSYDPSTSMSNNLSTYLSNPVSSIGIGLLYRHSIVRVEANIGVPISASASDGFQKGFQFGIGVSFL